MALNPIYNKWSQKSSWDVSFTEKLLTFGKNSTKEEIDRAFSGSIKFIDNKIISSIGVGTNLINEYTVTALAYAFTSFIERNKNENSKVFISVDNSLDSNLYMNIFARVLTEKNCKTVIYETPEAIPRVYKTLAASNSKCDYIVSIEHFNNDNKLIKISFNWANGAPLNHEEMARISWTLKSTDYLTIEIPSKSISFEYDNYFKQYQKDIMSRYVKSPYLNSQSLFMGIDITESSTRNFYLNNLKYLQISNFSVWRNKRKTFYEGSEQKYLSRVYWDALSRKSKINFVINNEGTAINFNVKYKHLYKYFKPDEIAALYLNFLLNDDETFNREDLNKSFIAKTIQVGTLTQNIALKNGIEVRSFNTRSDVWKDVAYSEKELLFAYTHNNEYAPYKRFFNGYDANHFMYEIERMATYYKNVKNKTLYDVLQDIYAEFGRYQVTVKSYTIEPEIAYRFFQRLNTVEKINNNYKIVRYQELSNNSSLSKNIIYKISFEHGESVICQYSQILNKLVIYCETIEQKSQDKKELMMVVRNREILDGILDLKEDTRVSKLTFWSFFKYFLYFLILFGIITFLFYSVYNLKGEGIGGGPKEVFKAFGKKLYTSNDVAGHERSLSDGYIVRSSFMFMVLSMFIYSVLQALIFKRVISLQGHKAKWKDLYIGCAIGVVIQTITPKSIGGDIGTYWYLRRRGIPRPVLFSAIIVNTFIWQTTNVLLTVSLVPTGVWMFKSFFDQKSTSSIIFVVMLVLGLIFDSGLSALLLIVVLNKRIQKLLIKVTLAIIEWTPFIKSYDAFSIKAKYEYELYNLNVSLKSCFKNIGFFFELLFYKIIPAFITTTAFFGKSIDIIQPTVKGGYYMNLTVQNTLIRISNAISLTPGGTGTSDYLYKVLVQESLQGTAYDGFSAIQNASIFTAMGTFGTVIIPSVISAILLIIVYIGEKRVDHYQRKVKNYNLVNNNNLNKPLKTSTNYYKIAMPIFFLVLLGGTFAFIFAH
ncbi:YbhN family protein [Mycoplasmopsis adleri]|uniref:lysylphosphatidylglycerol synthase transmembrane domain-containing protein n=1 Tax=Mycoplasmopsis adleri TaxID=51362 RepID=UPI0038734DA4